MSNLTKLRCNGAQVRQLRVQKGMTQEKLAAMSDVNLRTVQRAEQGGSIALETVASLAATLGVTVGGLTQVDGSAPPAPEEPGEENAVVLRRMTSGLTLIELICNSFSGKLYCAAEPTRDNIEALTKMVERVEKLIPNPWESPIEGEALSMAQRLREALSMTESLEELEKSGVAVFAGTYTARAQVPRYDLDEGVMCTQMNQRFEPVTVCRISINPVGIDRVTVRVADEWEKPAPQAASASVDDDEIPF